MKKIICKCLIITICVLLLCSCTSKTSDSEIKATDNEVSVTNKSEVSKDIWNIDNLKMHLKIDEESEVLFEEYYDFNEDGIDELIIAFGYDNGEERDYVDDIFYIGLIDENYEVYHRLEHSGYSYFEVDLIRLEDKEKPVLYCKITNQVNLEGFELYDIRDNTFNQLVYSASATGSGHDEMLDLDEDGVYNSYLQKRQSYDSLYTLLYRYYIYADGMFVLDNISANFYNYPSTPEDVVREYINLHALLVYEDRNIPDINVRLNELCPRNFEPPYLYTFEDMVNHNIFLDIPFILRTETFEQNNITYVYQEHQTDDKVPTVVYSLCENDGKWEIYDCRVIGGDKTLLSKKIDTYFIHLDNQTLLRGYKDVLLSKIPINLYYPVAEEIDNYYLDKIFSDGFWLKTSRFSLVDMDNDKVPELIVECTFGVADFVLVIREVDGIMVAEQFSNRQMSSIKKDGSFHASSGAGHHGFYKLRFTSDSYETYRVVTMEEEKKSDGIYQLNYYIGEEIVDEDSFLDYWDVINQADEPDWVYFE